MQLSRWLIIIVLIHSFFTCASAAGHIEDQTHASADIVFDMQHELEHPPAGDEQPSTEHEHSFHAHVSCITGYGVTLPTTPVILAPQPTTTLFGESLTHQPPVPPPNRAA